MKDRSCLQLNYDSHRMTEECMSSILQKMAIFASHLKIPCDAISLCGGEISAWLANVQYGGVSAPLSDWARAVHV